ncbi:MAG: Flagellar M-ring protein FliF [uncultured Solirubrobacteraceae bacterium]|uniref:Flagellar M-ring protein n=1 Tax=uncultured Solirubrobacteraceae bacterium TaxID=1162706 RepID=A0A6J4RVJ4_9ACTN|nr:MAG: Flagellar M-ring protein FliF [uncultured Solirubrobacteraceae bacterium]
MPAFAQNLSNLPTRGKVILGATAVGILLLVFFMIRLAGAPSYTTLQSGLDPAQTGKMTAALDELGIGYELQANGTALAVAKADTAKARIALAGQGLNTSGGAGDAPGFELFDEQKLGASDFQQKVTYQRALEGEIARNIGGVQGVQGAQVQLVMPEDDLFADEASPATAAVMLGNPGDTLEAGAVKGIAQLTSNSVKGLKPTNVTITDATGQVLWPSGDGAGGAPGGGSKQAAEERYARNVEAGINAMLSRTLGPDKAMVSVQADLNMDKTTRNELRYAKRGIPMTTETETERLRGQGGRAGGAAGTAGNIPNYSAGGGGTGNSNYRRETEKVNNALDKTVSKVDVAQGAVNRLNVALVLDKSVTGGATGTAAQQTLDDIESTVATAAGLDAARGDTITATQLAFAKPPAPPGAGPVPAGLLGPIKWAALALGALLFCFFMMRHLRRREREALPQPEWLKQFDQPVALAALEAVSEPPTTQLDPLPHRQADPSLQRLEQLMDREPERVAAQVRSWMDED